MRNWFRELYQRVWRWAHSKWSALAMFLCAFADASFLPLPTLVFFIGIILLNKDMAIRYFVLATAGTVLGAFTGYLTGNLAWLKPDGEFTALALFFIENVPGFSTSAYANIQVYYDQWDFWILFGASFIPLPYKIFAISSGVFNINILVFGIATIISQGIKYYLLALLVVKIGPEIKKLIEYKLKPVALFATCIVVLVIILIQII